jgi:hypothetical protein
MRLNIELLAIDIHRVGRSWISFLEINYGMPLLYLEWGQKGFIQFSFSPVFNITVTIVF